MQAEPDTPAAAYISAAITPNSIDHFVLLMTPRERRPVVAASISMANLIGNIPRQGGSEPQIRQLKLNWWLEEIEMISRGKPRHPLSAELTQRLTGHDWLDPLHRYVNGVLQDYARPPLTSLAELLPYCHRTSERQALIASVLPQCDELALTQARQIGVGICLTQLIRDRRASDSRLAADGFEGETASTTFSRLSTIAEEHFQAPGHMPAAQRHAQSSVLLQARLHRRLLERLRHHDYDAGKAAMRPLPLLWHAWREARNLIA